MRTPLLALAAISFLLPTAAQAVKLNGPLATEAVGSFSPWGPVTSPDGGTLAYVADRDGGPEVELYSIRSDGRGGPLRLTGALQDPGQFDITRNGKSVVFLSEADPAPGLELSQVLLDASEPAVVRLRGAAGFFAQSRDAEHVLVLADPGASGRYELYSVPIDPSAAPLRLNGDLVAGGSVGRFSLSADGRTVLYVADQDTDGVFELYVAPVDGSAPARRLPVPLGSGGDVLEALLVPDGSRAVYVADQEEDERFELYALATDGLGAPQKLNGPLVVGGDVGREFQTDGSGTFVVPDLRLSLDGRWVVFSADAAIDGRVELFVAPSDGSQAARLLSLPTDFEPRLEVLSPDSSWAVYSTRLAPRGPQQLFAAPLDGSAPAHSIHGPLPAGGNALSAQFSNDSRFVVYAADQDVDDVVELYSVRVDGSALPVKLSGPMVQGGDVLGTRLGPSFYVMADGVMYEADQEVNDVPEIYFAPVEGGVPARKLVAGPQGGAFPAYDSLEPGVDFGRVYFLRPDAFQPLSLSSIDVAIGAIPVLLDESTARRTVGDVGDFLLSASGQRVAYRARQEGDGELGELYSVPTEKPSLRARLHGPLSFDSALAFTPSEDRVIYTSVNGAQGVWGLFSEAVDGSSMPVQLDRAPAMGFRPGGSGDFDAFLLLPGGTHVVFLAGRSADPAATGLFVSPVDGSAPPTLLSGALDVLPGLERDAAGRWIAFRASAGALPALYVVPVDGGAPALRVDGALRAPESDYRLSPDGARIFFRTGENTGASELFVAPSDASAAPLRISTPMPALGDVTGFALDPLGLRVVYRADPVNALFELFSVPADGSAAPVRLHAPLAGGQDVLDFQVAATRVLFRADLRVDDEAELFSAPLDASRLPVRISVDLAPGTDVLDFQASPNGRRVLYRARSAAGPSIELFSAFTGGPRGQRSLGRTVATGDVRRYRISADSSTVAFTALRDPGGNSTLLAAPIGGEEKATELAGPFAAGGSVLDFALSADGARAIWSADQDEPGVTELYTAPYRTRPALTRR